MKRRAQGSVEVPINELASKLVEIKLKKEEIEAQEKDLKEMLKNRLEVGDHVDTDGYRISRIKTVTPFVSATAASSELDMDDFMQVVKVSVTELRKKMGDDRINEIAEKFDVKDYISVKELK
jgi:hypothetical protein